MCYMIPHQPTINEIAAARVAEYRANRIARLLIRNANEYCDDRISREAFCDRSGHLWKMAEGYGVNLIVTGIIVPMMEAR